MLTIKRVTINGEKVKATFKATAAEQLTLAGRVVDLDFGTVGILDRVTITTVVGDNTVTFNMIHPNPLTVGNYAVYFDTVTPTLNARLVDEGPYPFEKEENEL